jgi:hypothetical protein
MAAKEYEVVGALLEGGLDHRDGSRGVTQSNVELGSPPASRPVFEPGEQLARVGNAAGAGVHVRETGNVPRLAVAQRHRLFQLRDRLGVHRLREVFLPERRSEPVWRVAQPRL